jgi:hypothetical protein
VMFHSCHFCGHSTAPVLCSECEQQFYCSEECQDRDYKYHAIFCTPVTEDILLVLTWIGDKHIPSVKRWLNFR